VSGTTAVRVHQGVNPDLPLLVIATPEIYKAHTFVAA
jgi:hypothetical protein